MVQAEPITLTLGGIALLGKLLYGLGIIVTTGYTLNQIVKIYEGRTTADLVYQINQAAAQAQATNSKANINDLIFEDVRSFAQTYFQEGQMQLTTTYGFYEGYVFTPFGPERYLLGDMVEIGGSTYHFYFSGIQLYIYKDGFQYSTSYQASDSIYKPQFYLQRTTNGDMELRASYYSLVEGGWWVYNVNLYDQVMATGISAPIQQTISYTGAEVLSNPAWDWKDTETGKREISFPWIPGFDEVQLLDEIVTKNPTYQDALEKDVLDYNPAVDPPPIGGEISEGFIDGLFNGLKGFLGGLLDSLTGFLDGLLGGLFGTLGLKLDAILESLSIGEVTNIDFKLRFMDKFQISPLTNAWAKFQNMNTSKGNPPVIKINLGQIFYASTKEFGTVENPFGNEETTFIDFGFLEEYQFMGMALIDLFRTLIGAGFIMTTVNYIWNKVHPKEVI